MSVHDSNQSSVINLTTGAISCNEVENGSAIIDWSSLVIEPENDGDEKPPDEKAMFALFGLKTEPDERGTELRSIAVPTPDVESDLHDIKDADIVVDDNAPEEPLIAWDERNPAMDIGTPYPNMVEFRKALKQWAVNGEFEYGTKKNEPGRFRAFCKGQSIIGDPCKWALTASWRRDENCVMVVRHQMEKE
nr:uncharacterized protein LOC109763856 isoform X2 [Aegilops tauschii subsp. strangulata]